MFYILAIFAMAHAAFADAVLCLSANELDTLQKHGFDDYIVLGNLGSEKLRMLCPNVTEKILRLQTLAESLCDGQIRKYISKACQIRQPSSTKECCRWFFKSDT